jgi:hypothetical protein
MAVIERVECSGCGQEWHAMDCGGCGAEVVRRYVPADEVERLRGTLREIVAATQHSSPTVNSTAIVGRIASKALATGRGE